MIMSFKLTKEEFDALYSDKTPVGEHRKLEAKASNRIEYVIEFLEEFYFNAEMEFPSLVYDNSIAGVYGICSRETDRDHGKYNQQEYSKSITLVPQVEMDSAEEYAECKFSLIDIQTHKIELDPAILYTDFEDEIKNFIETNGDPEELRRLTEEKLYEQYRIEVKAFYDSLGPNLHWVDKTIDFAQWKLTKDI
jgi:hypothetical protein